jgi:Uma2 family endonuclease
MVVAVSPAPSLPLSLPEQRLVVYGVRWKDYVILREALDTPGLRMTFCEGALELMSPSRTHEMWKKTIARLIELYAIERNLPLNGYGSTTFRREAKERGAEPDECYRVGSIMKEGEFPDIVLEVLYTNPLLSKLHVYKGFEVPEVWLFRESGFELHRLKDGEYERVERSTFLPELDFTLIARFAMREDQHEALREMRALLR